MQIKSYLSLNKKSKIQFLILTVMFFCLSCDKGPDYPNIPRIEFLSITKDVKVDPFLQTTLDSITVSIRFEDGDGDLGVESEDVNNVAYRAFADTSFNTDSVPTYTFINYRLDMYRKENGTFVKVEPEVRYGGFFEPLVDYNNIGPIEGVLNYGFDLLSTSALSIGLKNNDTIKLEVYIIDRSLNISNKVTTDELIVLEKE